MCACIEMQCISNIAVASNWVLRGDVYLLRKKWRANDDQILRAGCSDGGDNLFSVRLNARPTGINWLIINFEEYIVRLAVADRHVTKKTHSGRLIVFSTVRVPIDNDIHVFRDCRFNQSNDSITICVSIVDIATRIFDTH